MKLLNLLVIPFCLILASCNFDLYGHQYGEEETSEPKCKLATNLVNRCMVITYAKSCNEVSEPIDTVMHDIPCQNIQGGGL